MFKPSILTIKRTQPVIDTKISWLMLITEINAVYSEDQYSKCKFRSVGIHFENERRIYRQKMGNCKWI
jgi:hypothetical protein